MSKRLFDFVKFSLAFSFAAFVISAGILKAQRNPGEAQITDRTGRQVFLYKQSHALIIWEGNYQHWNRLENTEVEAKQLEEALKLQGFNTTIVANPTGEQIRSAVDNFIASYGYNPDNRLVIFFTGHGHTRQGNRGYLVPIDAPDPTLDEPGFLRVAISMIDVLAWARKIEAKHVLFVFDSCFSGTVFESKSRPNPKEAYINTIMNKPVRQFLTAGDAGQEVPAKSIFTPLFIRAIEGEADYTKDGYITGTELGLYLTQNLSKYTQSQSPQYGKIRDVELDRGDIVFRSSTETIASPLPSPSPKPSPTTVATPLPSPQSAPSPSPDLTFDRKPTRSLSFPRTGTTLISKATGVDYTPLRDLLAEEKWKEADIETEKVMLQAANREEQGWLRDEDIDKFFCEDLRTINQLWLDSSNGKFGFSVQKEIYESLGGTREYNVEVRKKFGDRVGWRNEGEDSWLNYSDLTFNLELAPQAHLPALGIGWFPIGDSVMGFGWVPMGDGVYSVFLISSLAQRLVTCNI